MHKVKMKFRIISLVATFLGLSFLPASGELSRDRVLSDLNISQTEQEVVIRVGFNFPVRYVRHYPLDYGKEVNIQLEPIVVGIEDVSGLRKRESLSARKNNPAGLVRVDYEGNDLIKPTLRVILDKARSYDVRQGEDFRSLEVVLPMKTGEVGAVGEEKGVEAGALKPLKVLSPKRQEELLHDGEQAMAAQDYMRAILIYTELLNSADPSIRESAQFKLATAQEYKGHLAHARAEYKNYLNAYPEGENAEQARVRLKALMGDRPIWLGTTEDIAGGTGGWVYEYFGSLSLFYDRDESMFDNDEDIENISSLLTGFDGTIRAGNDRYKVEAVAIGSYEVTFLDNRDNKTRMNRLYIDFSDTAETFTSRVGRLSSSKGGVLTRFDGGQVGYRFMEKIGVNLVAGFPVNLSYDGLETDRYFYGINFDLGRFAGHWDFNTYFINQVSDDVDDRRAVGGEARFISQRSSFYSLLDYDILYDDVSLFLFTGNYLLPNDKTRISIQVDFRGVPILSTTNALIGQQTPSLEDLVETLGEDEVRRLAEDRTLDSRFATVGISQVLTENIQIAGDFSWSKIDGSPASGGLESFESTGDEFFYFLQLIGTGLIKQGDISSVGFRYADTQYRDTYTLTINTRYPVYDKLWFNPRMRIDYRENKIRTGDQWRFIPGLRFEYMIADNWRVEFDGEYRYADQELEGVADGKDGYAVSLGIRWDF